MEYENVLIPCDFSEYSEAAVLRAAEIHGVKKITLLHVGPPHEPSLNGQQKNDHEEKTFTAEQKMGQDKQFFKTTGNRDNHP